MKITKKEMQKRVKEYVKNGSQFMMDKYGHTTKSAVHTAIAAMRKELGIQVESKYKKRYTPRQKATIIKYFEKHGRVETTQKYGVSPSTVHTWLKAKK
jgi:DNA-directed RNA polymerase specialized sigma24 family protein